MTDIDWEFIRGLEGFESKGYVPKETNEKNNKVKSGVTIAGGFDLGQQTAYSIRGFKFSPALSSKLRPYLGVTGDDARILLKKQPLQLTNAELDELDRKVRNKYVNAIAKEFEDNSDLSFWFLTTAQKTVIVSVGFQYGSLKHRCPKFFDAVTKGLWRVAVRELKNFGDAYTKRRLKEAALLEKGIK